MRSLALLSLLLAIPAARAQNVSVYATVSPTYVNHLYTLSNSTPPATTLAGKWFVGVNGGVTFNFSEGPVVLGLDFRGGPEIGTNGLGSALGGFRVGFHAPRKLKPYGEFAVGFLEQRHQTGSGASTLTDAESYVAVELIGGVDYPIARHVDFRMVEVSLGTTHRVVSNGINTTQRPSLAGLSSGLVFNF